MFKRILSIVLTIAYPFVVLIGLKYWGVTALVGLIVLLCTIQLLTKPSRLSLFFFAVSLLLAAASFSYQAALPLKLYPVAVNLVLLCLFTASLFSEQTVIERLARLKDPKLPAEGVRYTRKVTWIWCIFFIINGSIALWTALLASDEIWALYNGFIAYILMGILLGGEWLFRRHFLSR